jgi:hypothetical protein
MAGHRTDCGAPKPAPFPVGTRLRYRGDRRISSAVDGVTVTILAPGIEMTVSSTREGRQGTGRQLRDEDGPMYDDDGEPICDTSRDGYSVVHPDGHDERFGRAIDPETARQWEVVR